MASEEDKNYCQEEIIDKYHFQKVEKIVSGGKERYHSVANGVMAAGETDYIFIHDGARPFVTQDMLCCWYAGQGYNQNCRYRWIY